MLIQLTLLSMTRQSAGARHTFVCLDHLAAPVPCGAYHSPTPTTVATRQRFSTWRSVVQALGMGGSDAEKQVHSGCVTACLKEGGRGGGQRCGHSAEGLLGFTNENAEE